jgi:hypothetical protein
VVLGQLGARKNNGERRLNNEKSEDEEAEWGGDGPDDVVPTTF